MNASPHRIRVFDACKAGFLYQYVILPRMKSLDAQDIVKRGSLLHTIAETNNVRGNLFGEKPSDKKEIAEWYERIKKRPYYSLHAEKEVSLSARLRVYGTLNGIIDRLCIDGNRYLVVDYKTSEMPDPTKDFQQLKLYALLLCKTRKVKAEDITLHLDYVAVDAQFSQQVSNGDILDAELYVIQKLKEMNSLVAAFDKHKDISKIEHCVSECSFCPMKGRCLAYTSVIEPAFPEMTETIEIVKQISLIDSLKKKYEERSKALKAALLLRCEDGDDVVSKYCSVVKGESTVYPSEYLLSIIIPEIVNTVIQNIKYSSLIPTQELSDAIKTSLLELLPDELSHTMIPEKYLLHAEPARRTIPKSPYIKLKAKEVACIQ